MSMEVRVGSGVSLTVNT